jgi:hypothetical protein
MPALRRCKTGVFGTLARPALVQIRSSRAPRYIAGKALHAPALFCHRFHGSGNLDPHLSRNFTSVKPSEVAA